MRTGLTVIAHISAKPGQENRVRAGLLELVAKTRPEKGCINYDLHQSHENPAEFVMYENWDSSADLDAHAKSAHLQAFGKIAGEILERPAVITKWMMVSDLAASNP